MKKKKNLWKDEERKIYQLNEELWKDEGLWESVNIIRNLIVVIVQEKKPDRKILLISLQPEWSQLACGLTAW